MAVDVSPDSVKSGGWWSRYKITVEPVAMVLYIVIGASASPMITLVMRQGCRMHGMDEEECSRHDEVQIEVHRLSATFLMISIMISTLPGSLISLFASPWSDTNGRKWPLIVALLGFTMCECITAWMSTVEDIQPYYFLLGNVPTVLGGPVVIVLSIYCYLIDVTVTEDRSIRFAILSATILVSQVIGSSLSPYLIQISYSTVYGVNAGLLALTVLYCCFILPESVKIDKNKKANFFTTKHVMESFRAYFKKRPHHVRGIIFALSMATLTSMVILVGELEVRYQAVMRVFHWNIGDYSQYTIICSAIIFICTFGGVYVGNTLLKIDEMKLLLGFQFLGAVGSFLMAWSTTATMYYVFSQLRCFLQCISPLGKGIISKTVESSDVAKVVSFMNTLDSFTPQLGALLYSSFYSIIVGIDPLAIHFLSSGVGLIGCLSILIVMFLRMRVSRTSLISE